MSSYDISNHCKLQISTIAGTGEERAKIGKDHNPTNASDCNKLQFQLNQQRGKLEHNGNETQDKSATDSHNKTRSISHLSSQAKIQSKDNVQSQCASKDGETQED